MDTKHPKLMETDTNDDASVQEHETILKQAQTSSTTATKTDKRKLKKMRQKLRINESLVKLQRFEFAQLNIRHQQNKEENTLNLVRRAIALGYDSVVINVDVGDWCAKTISEEDEDNQPPSKKKKKEKSKKQMSSQFPDPFLVDEKQLDLSQIEVAGKKFRQFRLTVTLTDPTSIHKLQQNPKRRLFDLVAIRCLDENMLTVMSKKSECFDIITMDCQHLDGKYPWLYKQKLIQACIVEGIVFEVCFGEALFDNDKRKQFFVNGRALSTITNKGRGIVLSAGTEKLAELRGPYDAANMCVLFGMPSTEGKKLVSKNCCQLLLRAHARNTIKGVVHIADFENVPVPPHSNKTDHLAALMAIPEFKKQSMSQDERTAMSVSVSENV